MIHSVRDVYEKIKAMPLKRVAVAQAADAHVLQAVCGAFQEGYVMPILVGDGAKIRAVAQEEGLNIDPFPLIDVSDDQEAVIHAVRMVHDGEADVVMKGLVDSSVFLKAVLNKEWGLRKAGATVSTIAVTELKKLGRLVFITDPGLATAPTLEQKEGILCNAVEIAHAFGIEMPVVAALSAAEKVNPHLISSQEAAKLEEMCRDGMLGQCEVIGPVSVDIALSKEAAQAKKYTHAGAGQADILLVPTIEVGNALYKSLMLFADMETGGIVAGTSAPVVFCSRADSPQTKKNTLAFAVYLAAQKGE